MNPTLSAEEHSFSSTLPILVLYRPQGDPAAQWQELDRGPGYFHIPAGDEVSIRIQNINDAILATLMKELQECPVIAELNLSENRNITDSGLDALKALPWLTSINLSSCSLTNTGLAKLAALPRLTRLNLSYCNRITDLGLKSLTHLNRLTYLDLQGCVKITNGGLSRLHLKGLTIHR